jgi:hypothetical protein
MGKKEFTKLLTPEGEDRLRVRIVIEKSKVKDVVIQYEAKIKDKWHTIVRYDCAHGFFHRDLLTVKGDKIKQPIAISNLNDALTYAEQDLKDRWEWYKEQYKRGMKK